MKNSGFEIFFKRVFITLLDKNSTIHTLFKNIFKNFFNVTLFHKIVLNNIIFFYLFHNIFYIGEENNY